MRKLLKKIIYRIAGPKGYEKAYVRGKISDIKNKNIDEPELAFLPKFIKDDAVVLDLGANYGHYAIEMAQLCPNGQVHAFEPIPFTFRVLKAIVSHFDYQNIELHEKAVSDKEENLNMVLPLLDFGGPNTGVAYIGQSNDGASETIEIETITVDQMKIQGRVDFIKMDIEGHEPTAFKGMEVLIKNNRPVILIEFSHNCLQRANHNPDEFAGYITNKLNYNFIRVVDNHLISVDETVPKDGYYFLIPSEKNIASE